MQAQAVNTASQQAASAQQAAVSAITSGDLTELNGALAAKFEIINERLDALEP